MNPARTVLIAALFFSLTSPAFAHSTVSPLQAETSTYQTFSLSVPTEREVPTTKVVLMVPEGIDRVTPVLTPGWRISVVKDAEGNPTQIEWTGGSIPADFKQVFEFTARTPDAPTTLPWKVYQTYAGGEVVAWDQAPHGDAHSDEAEEVKNPYSETQVMAPEGHEEGGGGNTALIVSILALIVSVTALAQAVRKNTA